MHFYKILKENIYKLLLIFQRGEEKKKVCFLVQENCVMWAEIMQVPLYNT